MMTNNSNRDISQRKEWDSTYANIDTKTVKFVIGDATDQKDVIFIINPPLGGLVGNAEN